MSDAAALKDLGNKAFAAHKYEEAIDHFSKAIALDQSNHVLYSNRCAALTSLKRYEEALQDAEKTVELKPDWAKGYSRKGAALHGLQRYTEAEDAYSEGLKLDPANATLKKGVEDVRRDLESHGGGPEAGMSDLANAFRSPDALAKLHSDPRTAPLMAQSDFQAIIAEVQKDPNSFSKHLNDPRFIQALSVVLGIGIEMGGEGDEPAEEAAPAPAPKKAEPAPAPEPEPEEEVDEETKEHRAKAKAEKDAGTAAYKSHNFEEALKHYAAAAEIDPADMVFHLNIGAVYLEMKEYEKCIEACNKAVEVGLDNSGNFKTMAKAYARIAKAHSLQENFADAVKFYDKALTNDRCRAYLDLKKQSEKQLKEQQRLAKIDPAKALEHKEKGNELFKAGKYPDAVKEYSEAIERNPEDGKLYSNRAAAYTKLAAFDLALKDCDECIRLEPNFIKGYLRKGGVQLAMRKPTEALSTFQAAEKIEPDNAEVKKGIQDSYEAMYGGNMSEEERREQALKDPEVQAILSDPVMQSMLQTMQQDPSALQSYMANPEIARKMMKLQHAGILRFQ